MGSFSGVEDVTLGGDLDAFSPIEEENDRRHFNSVISAYYRYRSHALHRISRTEKFITTLSGHHRTYLTEYKDHLTKLRWCVDRNYEVLREIVDNVTNIFINIPSSRIRLPEDDTNFNNISVEHVINDNDHRICLRPRLEDTEKVQSVLKQIVRDWSAEGAHERKQCYQPIIDVILKEFPNSNGIRVLVPGAGLGRLAFEIATKGYSCQGNEYSLFMLFASNFVINRCNSVNSYKMYPWAHQFVNNLSCDLQVKEVTFPDVDPSLLVDSNFSMVAGDFLKVYNEVNYWDCVATCFFIDCASNVIEFIETIYNILKPGTIWVNLGPLLYHYSDMETENSIEPPFDILCDIIKKVGFQMEVVKTGLKTKYTQNPKSMLQYEYDSVFFVCRKPKGTSDVDINTDMN